MIRVRSAYCIEPLEPRRLLTAFYLSPAGNDSNPANDPLHPWQTVAKLNSIAFSGGDQILFQSGQTFGGNLVFTADDHGSTASPVAVDSYGYDSTTGIVSVGPGRRRSPRGRERDPRHEHRGTPDR